MDHINEEAASTQGASASHTPLIEDDRLLTSLKPQEPPGRGQDAELRQFEPVCQVSAKAASELEAQP